MKHIVSIDQCSAEDILRILDRAELFEKNPNRHLLEGKVVATLFFEPSTRTRLSFETAVNRLGGRIIGFSDASTSSSTKGESLKDTISMVGNYADLIIMRHYLEGARVWYLHRRIPGLRALKFWKTYQSIRKNFIVLVFFTVPKPK